MFSGVRGGTPDRWAAMRLKQLQQSILERLAEMLAPTGFRKIASSFWKESGPARLVLHLSFIGHAADVDVTADVAVRHHQVEEVLNAERQLTIHEERQTATVGAELGNLAGLGQHRWTVAARTDVDPVCSDIRDWFQRIGDPFLRRFSSAEETLRVLETDGEEAGLICPIPATRGRIRDVLREALRDRAV